MMMAYRFDLVSFIAILVSNKVSNKNFPPPRHKDVKFNYNNIYCLCLGAFVAILYNLSGFRFLNGYNGFMHGHVSSHFVVFIFNNIDDRGPLAIYRGESFGQDPETAIHIDCIRPDFLGQLGFDPSRAHRATHVDRIPRIDSKRCRSSLKDSNFILREQLGQQRIVGR